MCWTTVHDAVDFLPRVSRSDIKRSTCSKTDIAAVTIGQHRSQYASVEGVGYGVQAEELRERVGGFQ